MTVWATVYRLVEGRSSSGGVPLRDMRGRELGPVVAREDWVVLACHCSRDIYSIRMCCSKVVTRFEWVKPAKHLAPAAPTIEVG